MTSSRLLLFSMLAAVVSVCGACKEQREAVVEYVPKFIPVCVWVVPADNEVIEEEGVAAQHRANRGCRFTETELTARVALLQSHASMYGPRVYFLWDGSFCDIYSSALRLQTGRIMTDMSFLFNIRLPYYEEGVINVYFAGCVNDPLSLGQTLDPGEEGAYILLNDGGGAAEPGFGLMPPDESLTWYALEHEMTHYLARFKERCYPLPYGPRCYSRREHVPTGQNNVLAEYGPWKLILPGDFDNVSTEKGEIWRRIRDDNWNNY